MSALVQETRLQRLVLEALKPVNFIAQVMSAPNMVCFTTCLRCVNTRREAGQAHVTRTRRAAATIFLAGTTPAPVCAIQRMSSTYRRLPTCREDGSYVYMSRIVAGQAVCSPHPGIPLLQVGQCSVDSRGGGVQRRPAEFLVRLFVAKAARRGGELGKEANYGQLALYLPRQLLEPVAPEIDQLPGCQVCMQWWQVQGQTNPDQGLTAVAARRCSQPARPSA